MAKELTHAQIEELWRHAGNLPLLAEMCERWLDTDQPASRASIGATIRSYLVGSKLESILIKEQS